MYAGRTTRGVLRGQRFSITVLYDNLLIFWREIIYLLKYREEYFVNT